jgi:hypothetical protein
MYVSLVIRKIQKREIMPLHDHMFNGLHCIAWDSPKEMYLEYHYCYTKDPDEYGIREQGSTYIKVEVDYCPFCGFNLDQEGP